MRSSLSARFLARRGLVLLACSVSPCLTACSGDGTSVHPESLEPGCHFAISASVSSSVETVGIVEWSTGFDSLKEAHVEFGLDEDYGTVAPVDLGEPRHRTLLLGLKPQRLYHYRIVLNGPGGTCSSEDQTLVSGAVVNGLPRVEMTSVPGAKSEGGYLVTCSMLGPAFILDADGEYVWAYGKGEMGRVELSHDGKHLWYAAINVGGGKAAMHRVTLDGLVEEDFSAEFGDLHHDFTVLPDETIAFIEHEGELDRVVERAADGTQRVVFEVAEIEGGAAKNHTNSIHYSVDEDVYTVSDLDADAYLKVTRAGEKVWVLGGERSDFGGKAAEWDNQHGHDPLTPDRFLFFNNAYNPAPSAAVELALDFETMTARRVWEYAPGDRSLLYGDVQRLSHGNTLVTFSTAGVIHEVDAEGALVRKLTWDLGGAPGYLTQRASLYGSPER